MAGQPPVNANASAEARELLSYLNSLMSPDAGLLTGQHNWLEAPMGNIQSLALPNSGGKYPAVIGLEMGAISGQSAGVLNSQRAEVANAAINYWKAGGIPTVMWHCTYPTMPYQWQYVQRQTSEAEFNQVLTPGDPKYNWLIAEMDTIAGHFKTMRDAKVPVLFRPFHEMNGYWFWWGKKSNYAALWKLTYDRFVNVHGLNNILWVWNPNCMKATDPGIGDFKLYYPGHSFVDVLAWDIYWGEFNQSFHDTLYAFGGGKPIALGEVGQLPDMNTMRSSQYRYTWAMAWGEPNFSSENSAANKQQFYAHPYAITRDEVKMAPVVIPPADQTSPSVPGGLTVAGKTSDSVSLSWNASTDNVGVTGYEVLRNGIVVGTTSATSLTVTGLAPATSYSFSIRAKDAAGNVSAASSTVTVTTNPASGSGGSPDNGGGVGTVKFIKGINLNGGAVTVEGNSWLAESAAGVTASGVQRYAGNTAFRPQVDAQTNLMLNSDIYSNGSFSVSQPLANGTYQIYLWTAENYRSNFRSFHIKLEGVQVTSSPIGSMPLGEWRKYGPFGVTVRDGVLNMDVVRVSGDPSISGMAIYAAGSALPDTSAPSVPSNVRVTAKTSSSVSLAWNASTDNVGVKSYDVLRNGSVVGTTSLTSFTANGLSPNTTYSFAVRARDAAGNLSGSSTPVSVTTSPASGGTGGTARFLKGINFGGGAVTVEGRAWLAESAAGISAPGVMRYTGNTAFKPQVDAQTNFMLNSDIYARGSFSVSQPLANGTYQIYLWSAENYRSNFRSFHIKLEGVQVTSSPIGSMPFGEWRKYGPFTVTVRDGVLNMDVVRVSGDPSLSGMAIYKVE